MILLDSIRPRVSLILILLPLTTPARAVEPEAFSARAQLTPRRASVLSTEIAGKIVTLPLREGEVFQEGQEIAGIECSAFNAKLAQARAQLARAQRKAEAIRLLDKRGATGKIDVDLAEIDVAAAEAEERLATIDVSHCSIKAPFSGRIAELKVQRYQFVSLGQPLVDILSDRELEVELLAPSRWLAWLKPGSKFVVHVDEQDKDIPAIVTRIGARIDPVSQSVKIFAKVDGEFPDLVPGMSGIAKLDPSTAGAALLP